MYYAATTPAAPKRKSRCAADAFSKPLPSTFTTSLPPTPRGRSSAQRARPRRRRSRSGVSRPPTPSRRTPRRRRSTRARARRSRSPATCRRAERPPVVVQSATAAKSRTRAPARGAAQTRRHSDRSSSPSTTLTDRSLITTMTQCRVTDLPTCIIQIRRVVVPQRVACFGHRYEVTRSISASCAVVWWWRGVWCAPSQKQLTQS